MNARCAGSHGMNTMCQSLSGCSREASSVEPQYREIILACRQWSGSCYTLHGQIKLLALMVMSLLLPQAEQQVDMQAEFANVDIVEANERVVLLSPFTPGDSSNRWSSPQLDSCVHKMWCVQHI